MPRPNKIPTIQHPPNIPVEIHLRDHVAVEVEAPFRNLGIELFLNGSVSISGRARIWDGTGNMRHPFLAGFTAEYRVTEHDNGDVQLDIHYNQPDPFGETLLVYYFDESTGTWYRIDFLDLGSPRHERAQPLAPISFAECEHAFIELHWGYDGTVEIDPGGLFLCRDRVLEYEDEEGNIHRFDSGRVRLPDAQVVITPYQNGTQFDVVPLPVYTDHASYWVDNTGGCRRIVRQPQRRGLIGTVLGRPSPDTTPMSCPLALSFLPRESETGPGIERGDRLTSLAPQAEEVRPWFEIWCRLDPNQQPGIPPFRLANVPFRENWLCNSLLICGQTGSGKSIILKNFMVQAFGVRQDPDLRAIVTNPKSDLPAFMEDSLPGVPWVNLNIFDKEAYALRIDNLLNHRGSAADFAKLMIPDGESKDPFWVYWGRIALRIVINHYRQWKIPFTLRTLYISTTTPAVFHAICKQSIPGRSFLAVHEKAEKQFSGIVAMLAQCMEELAFSADANRVHFSAGRVFDLRAFMLRQTPEQIAVLANHSEAESAVDAFNGLCFYFFSRLSRSDEQPEVSRPRNVAFIDEMLSFVYVPQIDRFANEARSSGGCIVGCTQSLGDLLTRAKELHKSSWPLRIQKIILAVDTEDGKWANEYCDKAYRTAYSWNEGQNHSLSSGMSWGESTVQGGVSSNWSRSSGEQWGSSHGIGIQLELTDAVPVHHFVADAPMPSPENGLQGFLLTASNVIDGAAVCGIFHFVIPFHDWPSRPRKNALPKLDLTTIETVYFDEAELEQLGLPAELISEMQDRQTDAGPPPITHEPTRRLLEESGLPPWVPGEKTHD